MKSFLSSTLLAILISVSIHSQSVTTLYSSGQGINDAIILLQDGSIIGSDHEGNSIYKLFPDGSMETIATGINAPNGLIIDNEENIYIGAPKEDKIYKLSSDGTLSVHIANILNPNNLIWEHGTNNFIVASYVHSKIFRVTQEGAVDILFEDAPLDGPLGMTYDSNNILYIANFTDGKIFKVMNEQLEFFAEIPSADIGGLIAAIGFIKYIDGYIYATGFGKNKIYRITMDGTVSSFAGSGFPATNDGSALIANFYWPNGITCNETGDTLYISEYNSHAIRMITDFTTGIDDEQKLPANFTLLQNYPNPFNPSTTITYSLHSDSKISIDVYNSIGENVFTRNFINVKKGTHKFRWNGCSTEGSSVSSGIYFYRISGFDINGNRFSKSAKMMLMK